MLTTQDIRAKIEGRRRTPKDVGIDKILLLFSILLLSALCLSATFWLASKVFF